MVPSINEGLAEQASFLQFGEKSAVNRIITINPNYSESVISCAVV